MMLSAGIIASLALLQGVYANNYNLKDNFVGSGFYSGFTFQAEPDPTHGHVNYVNQATAQAQNLSFASANKFVMKADSKTVLSSTATGRNSIRIQSNKAYSAPFVTVLDLSHMPQGCGTWPAFWTTNPNNWPIGGEIDIIEGVNDQTPNMATLHTSAGCTMNGAGTSMSGTLANSDCSALDDSNAGCGVKAPSTNSYGPQFNAAGGGWYAMEQTTTTIKVWFWGRQSGAPADVTMPGTKSVNTANWGTPFASFATNSGCSLASKFSAQNIIFDLTLCGDWAGQTSIFNSAGCPGDCVSFVNNNPSAFANAYWEINNLRVYQ